jgi:hypothetical protein
MFTMIFKKPDKKRSGAHQNRPHFSKALMKIAEANLKKFEAQADEDFLIRAKVNRQLDRVS